MTVAIRYLPMTEHDLDELAAVLLNESVYQHIGGMPSRDNFKLGLKRAMEGPRGTLRSERWFNYVARLSSTGEILGRLEATVHDGLSEVAFLYGPQHWGNGFATQGLNWLHVQLLRCEEVASFWATTAPTNRRSSDLLQRCGYVKVQDADLPPLYSYDEGDHVFTCEPVA